MLFLPGELLRDWIVKTIGRLYNRIPHTFYPEEEVVLLCVKFEQKKLVIRWLAQH